jgi:type IV pilus assembly protein PilV
MTTTDRLTHREGGVSLIEVLVAMILIALAMFSAIALQVYALRLASSSTSRSQAVNLSAEIGERMEANIAQAMKGAYATPTSSTASSMTTDCSISACAPADLVAYDLAMWSQKILNSSLTNPTWTITVGTLAANTPTSYTIVLTWDERRDSAQNTNYSSTGTADTLTLTTTKVLSQ